MQPMHACAHVNNMASKARFRNRPTSATDLIANCDIRVLTVCPLTSASINQHAPTQLVLPKSHLIHKFEFQVCKLHAKLMKRENVKGLTLYVLETLQSDASKKPSSLGSSSAQFADE
eukprot:250589-Amphidinium_carterae.1